MASHRAGDLDQPLLAMRQVAGQIVGALGQADEAQQRQRGGRAFETVAPPAWQAEGDLDRAGLLADEAAEPHVIEHRHVLQQLRRLEGAADTHAGDV
jgi:hypothetical protein